MRDHETPAPPSSSLPPPPSSSLPPPPPVWPFAAMCGVGNPEQPPSRQPDVVFLESEFVRAKLDPTRQILRATYGPLGQPGFDRTVVFCKLLNSGVEDNFDMVIKFGIDPYPNQHKVLNIWYVNGSA